MYVSARCQPYRQRDPPFPHLGSSELKYLLVSDSHELAASFIGGEAASSPAVGQVPPGKARGSWLHELAMMPAATLRYIMMVVVLSLVMNFVWPKCLALCIDIRKCGLLAQYSGTDTAADSGLA